MPCLFRLPRLPFVSNFAASSASPGRSGEPSAKASESDFVTRIEASFTGEHDPLKPNPRRVLFREFRPPSRERIVRIIARVMSLSEEEIDRTIARVRERFQKRHQDFNELLESRYRDFAEFYFQDQKPSKNLRHLIAAYFTQEYAVESAALFNPSMIWHPDQSGLEANQKRFLLSLRAVGEGHISSLVFRVGVVTYGEGRKTEIAISNETKDGTQSVLCTPPRVEPTNPIKKRLFKQKLEELGIIGYFVSKVLEPFKDVAEFSFAELEDSVQTRLQLERIKNENNNMRQDYSRIAEAIMDFARSNCRLTFEIDEDGTGGPTLSERVIFPSTPNDSRGIEDARFVEFRDPDAEDEADRTVYYATYTAYNGQSFMPQLLETRDFVTFELRTLNGSEVKNKGMALFPEKIGGRYAMLSRQDNENNFYMAGSENTPHFWDQKVRVMQPTFPWSFVQLGNCGSPLKIDDPDRFGDHRGWLVLSHGVGPMREYSIGAYLLDLDDPAKLIKRTEEPFLQADDDERIGYVPNVVYSCGGQLLGTRLLIPYAMSDSRSGFAEVDVPRLLDSMSDIGCHRNDDSC